MDNHLKQRLHSGECVYGIMLSELYVPNMSRLIAMCGYDFLLVDCEHGYFDMTQVANLIAVAEGVNLPVIIRVAQPSRTMITKYLDMGARGILLANVKDEEEARRLLDVCLYAPDGDRGISTFRAHTGYNDGDTFSIMRNANACNVVICQIESPHAVEMVDQILALKGVDGVLVGPNDLTQHMGIFSEFENPAFHQVLEHVATCARAAGKWSGVITGNMALAQKCRSLGMTCFSAGSELSTLAKGAKMQLKAIREATTGEETTP